MTVDPGTRDVHDTKFCGHCKHAEHEGVREPTRHLGRWIAAEVCKGIAALMTIRGSVARCSPAGIPEMRGRRHAVPHLATNSDTVRSRSSMVPLGASSLGRVGAAPGRRPGGTGHRAVRQLWAAMYASSSMRNRDIVRRLLACSQTAPRSTIRDRIEARGHGTIETTVAVNPPDRIGGPSI